MGQAFLPTSTIFREANAAWDAAMQQAQLSASLPENSAHRLACQHHLLKGIAELDRVISEQTSAVMQASQFKHLESRWRSLQSLIALPVSQRRVNIKLLDWDWADISHDLNFAFDMTQSQLYNKVYARELDTAGGQPFNLMLVDHRITFENDINDQFDDLYTLQLLAELGELALCPFLLGVDDAFLGDDLPRQYHDIARAKRIFTSDDFSAWNTLRENKASRFLHLVLPSYLQRLPYEGYAHQFVFTESLTAATPLWGNTAYLFMANVMREFDRISWFGFLRAHDPEGKRGALVATEGWVDEEMAFPFVVPTPTGERHPLITNVDLMAEQEYVWAEMGFVPLSSVYITEQKGFFSNQSVWLVPEMVSPQLGMLQTNLMACRFGHYIKKQVRELVGRYDSAADCKRLIERWLSPYISDLEYADDAILARYPLKAARVEIVENSADKTQFSCHITIRPQYQYEIDDVEVMLTTSLKQGDNI